ncbi:MAG: PilN domain-containing protein [Methylophilaceae bacterium]
MTARLELELTRSASELPTWTWLGGIVFITASAFSVLTWQAYQILQNQHEATQAQLQVLEQAQQRSALVKPVAASQQINQEQLQTLKLAEIELKMPWNALFDALGKSSMKDVAILALQPDSKKQQVIISGEAKNYTTVLTYIDRLSQQPNLTQVYLQKHVVNDADQDKPIRFSLFARWQTAYKLPSSTTIGNSAPSELAPSELSYSDSTAR